jgi:hypothetical protein
MTDVTCSIFFHCQITNCHFNILEAILLSEKATVVKKQSMGLENIRDQEFSPLQQDKPSSKLYSSERKQASIINYIYRSKGCEDYKTIDVKTSPLQED